MASSYGSQGDIAFVLSTPAAQSKQTFEIKHMESFTIGLRTEADALKSCFCGPQHDKWNSNSRRKKHHFYSEVQTVQKMVRMLFV